MLLYLKKVEKNDEKITNDNDKKYNFRTEFKSILN